MNHLLRLEHASQMLALKKSQIYKNIQDGTCVRPVPIGPRARAFPANEVQALVNARIAGKTEAELKALVTSLHEARKALA